MAKRYNESSLKGFTDDTGWNTGDYQSAQIERKVSHKSAFPELTDTVTRDFTEGKSVNSVSDRFRTLFMRRQNPCVDHYVREPTGCDNEYKNVPRCRKTSLFGCSSSIQCYGTRKCVRVTEYRTECGAEFVTGCECADC